MPWPESVDEALCYGWIDGVRKTIDAERYVIRFSPRKPVSLWSNVNIAKVKKLIEEDRMRPTRDTHRAFCEASVSLDSHVL